MGNKKIISKNKGRKYQNKVTRNLSILLIINSLVYLLYNPRSVDLNIDVITEISTYTRNITGFNYNINIFALVNFFLIALAAVKILFIGKRLPIILTLILLFIFKFDDNLVLTLGKRAILARYMLDVYISNLDAINNLNQLKFNREYLNYAIAVAMPIYLLIKRMTYDALFIKIEQIIGRSKKKKESNTTFNNTARSNNRYYSNGTGYQTDNEPRHESGLYDNYSDLDDDTYTYSNSFNNNEKLKIWSDSDKERAYNMSMVEPFKKVVDESGIEMYAWEYGNIYEEEKRKEDFDFQQEQFLYNSNSDNDYPIYNPYRDDNSYNDNFNNDYYNSSYDNDDTYSSYNDDYYGSSYNNDDYYDNSYNDDYYGSNDSWF